MPRRERTCCRWTVTIVQVVICIIAAGCILSVMLIRGQNESCLPPFVDKTGKIEKDLQNDFILNEFCHVVLYAAGAISGWCILSSFVHCCWENKVCFALQTVVYIVISVLCLTGSASLTSQFILWCENMKHLNSTTSDITCEDAVKYYDNTFPSSSINMSVYYKSDLIQQGCTWGLAFLSMFLAFIYISLLCINTGDTNRTRIIYVRDGEQQPLIPVPEDSA